MTTVSRNSFVAQLSGGIDVRALEPGLEQALAGAGLDPGALRSLAGADGRIGDPGELRDLFELVDSLDSNGSSRSFATVEDGRTTPAGALFEGLKDEVARRRLAAATHGIIHVGMRPESSREVAALVNASAGPGGGVHAIRAAQSDGTVAVGSTGYDLTKASGQTSFRTAVMGDGMPPDQAARLLELLVRTDDRSKDEVAALGLALHKAGTGELAVSRLVLSGHSGGSSVGGEGTGTLAFASVRELAEIFPHGAGQIRDLAISGCFSADLDQMEMFRHAFPRLDSVWAYDEFSPSAERGAPAHLRAWEGMTDGDRPGAVDPRMSNVVTWNATDGYQWQSPKPLGEVEAKAAASEYVVEEYRSGRRPASEAPLDAELRAHYAALRQLQNHPDVDTSRRTELRARADELLFLRHPELR